ncbi:hypothetical protein PH586_11160 [Pseudomonas sp. SA3-5]|uniref:Energy transducer TonB n=1 Tax=Pseudomonas aestuarii TaxID=3018340 RepID=A0ABT4XFI1_9PSED|nr:hypothetical protein [Pseudomonas aestuarii]MDA7086942.1 hypothetical protein [Pseudomonas aestuarii]
MKALLQLLRSHWRLVVLVLIVLLLLPAVVAALKAAEEEPETPVATEPEPEPDLAPAPAPAPAMAEAVEPAGVTPPFSEYQEMIERPLFSSTRRPPVLKDEPQENLDAEQLREAWRLSGIALEQGRQLASFSEREGDQRLLLELGMALADEWRLEQIGSDYVLLSNGASEVRMPLREPVATAPPAEPGAAPVPQAPRQSTPTAPSVPATTDNTPPPADTPAPAALAE